MAKITFPGLADYELMISRLSKGADDIAGKAIYAGAKIVTDQIAKNIRALPIVKGFGSESKPLPGGVTVDQKKGLLETLGIAPMQDDHGYYNVKVGFDGYIETTYDGDVYRQPAPLVARSTESGTYWKNKSPFVRPAINATRKQAEAKMAEIIDAEMQKIMDDADKNIKA